MQILQIWKIQLYIYIKIAMPPQKKDANALQVEQKTHAQHCKTPICI